MNRWYHSLLLLPLALTPAFAADEKAPEPISIEADRMEIDQTRGTSHYQGNVVLQRGELRIQADEITLHTSNNKLQRAVAEGQPVVLQQPGDTNSAPLRAEATHMEYLPATERVELSGQAHLWRDGNEFSGERISYDLKQQLVKASGNEQGEGRVRVLLQPAEKEPATGERQ